ncbi:class I adenylate-forming enzyme family protein [Streptomyces sp. NPDC059002]|uniref:class I adenylate-forming enzyme family protein n=1 Tax=Streptomyces sp. NPDC059002 TaxID=3346690 RepID=UPI0036795BD3
MDSTENTGHDENAAAEGGAGDAPLARRLAEALAAQPADTVWARAGTEVTWGRLRTEVAALERDFAERGIGPGSAVAVRMTPSFSYLWTVLALWSRGAQVVLIDPRSTPAEVARLLALCDPGQLIDSGAAGAVRVEFRDTCAYRVEARPEGRAARTPHALIQFTSGSTGHPKAIGRTAASLLAELDRFAALPEMPGAGERVLLGNSLTHSFGLLGGVLHALCAGATLLFAPDARPRTLLTTLAEQRAHVLFGVPFHFELLTHVPDPVALPDLRLAVSGGEALRLDVYERFKERYGIRIGQAYGMTETGIAAVDLTGTHRPPVVGRPAPGMELEVRAGELYIRTDGSPYAYDQGGVRERYADGWLRTHDRCRVDANGVLSLHGRTDALVAVGGLKVDLREVELALAGHPDVTEVVVLFEGAIEAFVGAKDGTTARALQTWCRERLSLYKVPRRFEVAPAIPRTSNGKLLRNRELLLSRMGAAAGAPVPSEAKT